MNVLNSSETGDWGSRPSSLIPASSRENHAKGRLDCIVIKQNVLSAPTLVCRVAQRCVFRVKPQPTTIPSAF